MERLGYSRVASEEAILLRPECPLVGPTIGEEGSSQSQTPSRAAVGEAIEGTPSGVEGAVGAEAGGVVATADTADMNAAVGTSKPSNADLDLDDDIDIDIDSMDPPPIPPPIPNPTASASTMTSTTTAAVTTASTATTATTTSATLNSGFRDSGVASEASEVNAASGSIDSSGRSSSSEIIQSDSSSSSSDSSNNSNIYINNSTPVHPASIAKAERLINTVRYHLKEQRAANASIKSTMHSLVSTLPPAGMCSTELVLR